MATNGGTFPWVYVAVGCGVIVVLGLIGIGSCVFLGSRWVADMEALQKDPQARTEKAQQILSTPQLPDGYYAATSFSIPLLGEVLILNDRPPDAEGESHGVTEKGFFYINFLQMDDEDELEDFFRGEGDSLSAFGRMQAEDLTVDLHDAEITRRGALEMDGYVLDYAVIRGGIEFRGQDFQSLSNLMWIHCPDDNRLRLAGWLGRDPDPQAQAEDLDYSGTPGDEESVRGFLGEFDFCK